MKILSVQFLNLNSLKGLHTIRFDKEPFLKCGLFAITGSTGAGKTTILDAITVALYGRVHRHDKNAEESITRFTSESFSEVEFEVNEKVYKARWAQRRSHGKVDGNLQSVKMEVCEMPSGNILASHRISEVQNKIVEICGLDYGQFLRSVMLAQGDFTQFLKSKDNERSELLEKITDTGIYSEISTYIYKKTSSEQQKLNELKNRMNDVQLLGDEVKLEITHQIKQLNEQEEQFKKNKTDAEQKLEWIRRLKSLEEKKTRYETDLQQLQLVLYEKKAAFEKLQLHLKAIVYKPELAEITLLVKRENTLSNQLSGSKHQLPKLQNELKILNEGYTYANNDYKEASEQFSKMIPVLENVIGKDAELKTLRKQLLHSKETAAVANLQRKNAKEEVHKKKMELAECNSKIKELSDWQEMNKADEELEKELPEFTQMKSIIVEYEIALIRLNEEIERNSAITKEEIDKISSLGLIENELKMSLGEKVNYKNELISKIEAESGEKSLQMLDEEYSGCLTRIILLKEQKKFSEEAIKENGRKAEIEKELFDSIESLVKVKQEYKTFSSEKETAENHLTDLRELVELQIKIQKYDEDRQQLEFAKPCPLCGSMHHPFQENNYHNRLSEAELSRNMQEIKVSQLSKKCGEKLIEINTLLTIIEGFKKESLQIEKNATEICKAYNKNNRGLQETVRIEDDNEISCLLDRYLQKEDLLKEKITTIKTLQNKLSEVLAEINLNDFEQLKVAGKASVIEEHLKSLAAERERLLREQKDITERSDTSISKASNILDKYGIDFDKKSLGKIETVLKKRSANYQKYLQVDRDKKLLQSALISTYENAVQKEKALVESEAKCKSIAEKEAWAVKEKTAKRLELFGDKDPVSERNRMNEILVKLVEQKEEIASKLKVKDGIVKELEVKLKEWEFSLQKTFDDRMVISSLLMSRLQRSDILSIEELQSYILPEEEAASIESDQQSISSKIKTISDVLKNTAEEYKKEISKKLTHESVEKLLSICSENEQGVKYLNQMIGEQKTLLKKDSEAKAKYLDLSLQIQLQQKEFDRWNKLCSLIGSADGKKFSRFAQGLTLARLTELANRHLKKLSDRYQIFKSNEKDLDLQIIDFYQAEVIRPMSTLSGGESFLVSLALALGLSDLAGRKVQIRSLFIDEGFGTLDAETIDVAISALENLQASGKMIGIISHVEALKDRITTQIVVSRQPGGYSKISFS